MQADSHAIPTSVYRYYDQHGLLLYVGITSRSTRRNDEHTVKEWWPYAVTQEIEQHPDRGSAEARERDLIRRFHPPFNVQHNPEHLTVREAYVRFASAPCGEPRKRIDLYPTSDSTGSSVWLVSRVSDAATVACLDPGVSGARLPRRNGRVLRVERLGNMLAIEVETSCSIERATVTTKYLTQRPVSLVIKAVDLTTREEAAA